MEPKKTQEINYAIWLAGLTNQELIILKLWMDGCNQCKIISMLDLDMSQPALSKKIDRIQTRVSRAYFKMKSIINKNK